MKLKRILSISLLGLGLAHAPGARAADKTWNAITGDFLNPANWTGGLPGADDVGIIDNNGTATLGAAAGTASIASIKLGTGGGASGHIVMNGGRLNIAESQGDPKPIIGNGTTQSTFIMNGGTIFLDGPDQGALNSGYKGLSELDWEVGEKGLGRFEMHGNSVFRASDDLKLSDSGGGTSEVVIDGNSKLSVGSGISVSGGANSHGMLTIGGNALVESGNSMGAGDPLGGTDEGYLTLASGGGISMLTVQDNAILNYRRISAREGDTTIVVKNRGQMHIFDVLNSPGTNAATRAAETGPNSAFVSAGTGTLTLQDDAQFTVNSDPAGGPIKGFAVSGPRDSGNPGGTAKMLIRDRALFRVEQDLGLGNGANPDLSDGTLEIVGPSANVSIGGNFNMAVNTDGEIAAADVDGNPKAGKSTLSAVITASSHSPVNVAGIARIGQGRLKVKLDGVTPASGATFALIKGGTIEGQFTTNDFSEAPLAAGLSWQVEYKPAEVNLKVTGQAVGNRTLVVTTANNANPPAGALSLAQAMAQLQPGDKITFNIPGTGPHVIASPVGGYPVITVDNVSIDGYTQPGATPNTNPILAENNAKIGIVLDSRNGNVRLMDFAGDSPNDQTGYGDTEAATFGVLEATNVTIRGFSFLTVPLLPGGSPGGEDVGVYAVAFAKGAQGHVNGCWIGIHPDGQTLGAPADAITGFRYRVRDTSNTVLRDILVNNVVIGVKKGSTAPQSEFNVIVGIPAIPIIIEGNGTRISGNFLNVFPSGVQDFNPPLVDPTLFSGTFEGNIEIGRGGNNTVIGVDGDGINDAHERNVLSGVVPEALGGYDHNIEFYGQTPGTNIVIAGNYIGMGINGTRFTNGVPALNAAGGSAQFRFGSDFDGVSDALEGNVVYNHWPQELFTLTGGESFFDELSTGGIVGARGNSFVNNAPFPVNPARASGDGTYLQAYYAKALANVATVTPELSTNTSLARLIGKAPRGNTEYTNLVIDLYAADPEGIELGKTFNSPEMPNGFVQGKAYIGSFVDNSAADANKTAGEFDFSIANFELRGSLLTVTANYSKTPSGTPNGIWITSPFSEPVEVTFLPGSIESVGLSRIQADKLVIPVTENALGNWEPNASVIGTTHFLVEANTFADQSTEHQRFVVAVQPAAGGAAKTVEGFHTDAGAPYKGQINLSRQNGNPGRVAGDKRPGAVNYIVGGEISAHGFPEFQSNTRWAVNGAFSADHRWAGVQTYALHPATLDPVPLTDVFDAVLGNSTATFSGNTPEVSRFGGEVAALDNGNFVVVIDDRSNLIAPRRTATAAIITPNGEIVNSGFAIDGAVESQIWANVAAHKGGFVARFAGQLYFFDNTGNLLGKVAQSTSGLAFDAGRGDGTRLAGHINSPYVYLAGKVANESVVKVAVWDARTRAFVASADASEGAFTGGFDRANLAVDALNRVCVSWVSQPAGYTAQQVAARVLAFNESTKTFTALTKSFLPFVNSLATPEGVRPVRSVGMSVAMTTKQILVAAKGEINLNNQPNLGADSANEVNFYTVFTHPDPKEDPTPAAGGGEIELAIVKAGPNSLRLDWEGGSGPFLVQRKNAVNDAAWMNVLTTSERSAVVPNDGATGFFRVMGGATITVTPLSVVLNGAGENPAVNTPGIGRGTLSLEGNKLSFDIKYSGLTVPASLAHIHGPATTDLNTGVLVNLAPFNGGAFGASGRLAGSVDLTESQKASLLAGDTYVNIHTPGANSGGEIRGQISPANLKATINGASEVPVVDTTATGTGKFTLVGDELFVDVSYTGLKGPIRNAHIHGPAATTAFAGVLVDMMPMHTGTVNVSTAAGFKGSVVLNAASIRAIIDGLSYFNIHSTFANGGEIRGQIVP